MKFVAEIDVMPLDNLLDPQGKAVKSTLHTLGFNQISDVRIGQHIRVMLEAESYDEAKSIVEQICQKVLHNPVVQQYSYQVKQISE